MPENEELVTEETLEDLTINAFLAEDFAKAEEYATQMLKEPEKLAIAPYWSKEEVRYWGHMTLAFVVSHRGDEEASKAQRRKAGEMPVKQTIDRIRPDLDLIKKMQDAGEKEALIAHLETSVELLRLCSAKRERWTPVLQKAIAMIEQRSSPAQSEPPHETEE